MLIKAILVALLATGSQWWFSHLITRTWLYPIWSGFLTGVIMGAVSYTHLDVYKRQVISELPCGTGKRM